RRGRGRCSWRLRGDEVLGGDGGREALEQRPGRGDGAGGVRLERAQSVDGPQARGAGLGGGERGPAADGDRGDPGPGGGARHPDRGLAVERLLVEAALAGDDEVGPGEAVGEAGEREDLLDPRSAVGAEEEAGV